MKPDKEMRADMEEADLEPCDVFVDLGMLVVEGRTPCLTGRGYGEGPHCFKLGTQTKHRCNPQDPQCVRDEQFRKHMLLLWRNNIPMSIEVLLSPEATRGNPKSQNSAESGANYTLLEQWTIYMLPKRVPDVLITGKSLLHAVRSYLHFSQLSAWYSLSTGKIPSNVVYRICVPGEAFSNKFNDPPDTHSFPVANVGRNNAMKVQVKSMPRCSGIPSFLSHKLKDPEAEKLNMACALDPVEQKRCPSPMLEAAARRENSPDTLLGESLLDPPQSLQMYPKRYQSPSRCGSPVMEAPDHLLCRNRETSNDGANCLGFFDGERSRSRRPFDKNRTRYLQKEVVVDRVNKVDKRCFAGFALTPKETEEVLNLLHKQVRCKNRNKIPQLEEVFELKTNKECQVWNTKEILRGDATEESFHKNRHFEILDSKRTLINLNEKCDENETAIDGQLSSSMKQLLNTSEFKENVECQLNRLIPSAKDKAKFRQSLDSATSLVFHCKTGLPLTSSPAPVRKGTCFDFDSTLTSPTAIKNALFEKEEKRLVLEDNQKNAYLTASATNNSLLGSFEESVLNGRLEPVSTVEGFTAEIGASGSFCPRHITVPVTVFFYTLSDTDKVSTPYLGHINLGQKGYHVPKKGTIQVTLFNPHGTVVKMFVVVYDLGDMPINCQTFLRQRTLYLPVGANVEDHDASKWLRYLIHLRFASSKSGRIYLHTDMRLVIFRKSEMDAATISGTYELRSFTRGPTNPKFSPLR